ncbi:MAG: pyridoxal phosphate-dependent aminotransferase [Planctomycetota bacterium]
MNIGQPDIKTPPEFFDAITQANLDVVAYSPSAGIGPLRETIAAYYQRIGHSISSQEVLVTTGASEALGFVMRAVLDPGDEIIVPEPFYANYMSFSMSSDGIVVPLATSIENDFQLPTPEEFEAKITDRTRAILICNPGNPTGVLYPKESLEQLAQIVQKHGLFLIADEVYREFAYDGLNHHSVLGFSEISENVIVIDSISKRFSACGARIGNIVTRNQQLLELLMRMAQARLSPPTFGQLGATAVYELGEDYYQTVRHEYAARRDLLKSRLDRIDGVLCPQVNGAFYAMVRLPVPDTEDFCQWMLENHRHDNQTIMLAPGSGFYASEGSGRNEVRIAYVLNQKVLNFAMDCLESGIEIYNRS